MAPANYLSLIPLEILICILRCADRLDLLVLAAVSSVWRNFALEIFYERIESFQPLLHYLDASPVDCMPASREFNWSSFDRWASRVREVCWSEEADLTATNDICRRMTFVRTSRPNDVLLPSLNAFHATVTSPEGLSSILYWTLPSMKVFSLTVASKERGDVLASSFASLLGFLDDSVVLWETFKLVLEHKVKKAEEENVIRTLMNLLHRLPKLQSLALIGLPRFLDALPVIYPLLFNSIPNAQYPASSSPLSAGSSNEPDVAPGFLDGLRTVEIEYIPSSKMNSGLQFLVQNCTSLSSISIHSSSAQWSSFSSLLECRLLERLSLHTKRPLQISDEDIMQMLQSWPSIKHLHLNPQPSRKALRNSAKIRPTLQTLYNVANAGRQLKYFAAFLRADGILEMMEGAPNAPKHDGLEQLRVGFAGLSHEVEDVTMEEILHSFFPNATFVPQETDPISIWTD